MFSMDRWVETNSQFLPSWSRPSQRFSRQVLPPGSSLLSRVHWNVLKHKQRQLVFIVKWRQGRECDIKTSSDSYLDAVLYLKIKYFISFVNFVNIYITFVYIIDNYNLLLILFKLEIIIYRIIYMFFGKQKNVNTHAN